MRDTAHSAATLLKKLGMSNPEIRPTLYLEQLGQNWGRIREIPQSTGLHPRPTTTDPLLRLDARPKPSHIGAIERCEKMHGRLASAPAGIAVAG
ncbi:MAG: hypothetical protein WBW74_07420 [Xanthobacteraceae bacterium]